MDTESPIKNAVWRVVGFNIIAPVWNETRRRIAKLDEN